MANDMSFLPEDYLQRRIARRTNLICISLFVVVICGTFATHLVTQRQWTDVNAMKNRVDGQMEEAAMRLEQLEKLQEQKQEMIRKANVTSALRPTVERTLLLAELINHMPASLSLLEFELETKTLRTRKRPRNSMERAKQKKDKKAAARKNQIVIPKSEMKVSIIGVAPTDVEVAQFMTALGAHEMFEGVSLQYSEKSKINDRQLRKFRVDMTINQDIRSTEIEPTFVRRGLKNNPMSDTMEFDADKVAGFLGGAVIPVAEDAIDEKGN